MLHNTCILAWGCVWQTQVSEVLTIKSSQIIEMLYFTGRDRESWQWVVHLLKFIWRSPSYFKSEKREKRWFPCVLQINISSTDTMINRLNQDKIKVFIAIVSIWFHLSFLPTKFMRLLKSLYKFRTGYSLSLNNASILYGIFTVFINLSIVTCSLKTSFLEVHWMMSYKSYLI